MNEKQLKEMLKTGLISQEAFDKLAQGAGSTEAPAAEPEKPEEGKKPEIPADDFDRRIQSAIDRATNKLGNEKKRLEEQLEKMKKEKMTDEERKTYELQEKERTIQEREALLKQKENKLYAIKALKKAGLDDGSDTSLELAEFIIGDDEAAIDSKVKCFSALINKMVAAEVDKIFKTNGGKPSKGGPSAGVENPYKKETYNLTKQMELENTNPELAKQLEALAG